MKKSTKDHLISFSLKVLFLIVLGVALKLMFKDIPDWAVFLTLVTVSSFMFLSEDVAEINKKVKRLTGDTEES